MWAAYVVYLGICLFCGCGRYLPPLHIHGIIFLIDQVGHFHKLISFSFQRGDERIQRLGGVLRPVVAQDDGAVAQMLVVADGIHDGVHTVVLPVEGILVRYTWNRRIFGALCDFTEWQLTEKSAVDIIIVWIGCFLSGY